jgi:hypothetical protein
MKSADGSDAADLLLGADAITRYVNELLAPAKVSRHAVYRWLEAKRLPSGRLGAQVLGSRRLIREHLERIAGGTGEEP